MADAAMIGTPRYERIENDAYQTPAWCVDVLCDHWEIEPGLIWEPAAGDGNIERALLSKGFEVAGSDIGDTIPQDFFTINGVWYGPIITNPPYKIAEKFVRHALDLGQSQVCMLLRHEWDCAKTRNDLFTRPSFAKKITLTKRPYWTESRKASPRHNFAWFCWDRAHRGPPTIEYGP